MSEKKIDDKVLDKNDLNELYVLLSKINKEVKQMWFTKLQKYKTKQWREFMTDWKMNFDQRLLNDKLTLNNWTTKKDPGTLTCLIELLKIIIDHPDAHAHNIFKQAIYFWNKLYQITTKTRKQSIYTDANRQKIDIIKNCAEKLAKEGYDYYQHYGPWLIALYNHITESNESKKQKLMIEQFKKDYRSKLGRIILRRPKELQIRLGSALVKLYNHNKKMIEMVTPQNLKSLKDDKAALLGSLATCVFIPAIGCQCDIWEERKFTVSKYNSFRNALESGDFNALLDVVFYYLILNLQNQTTNNSNKDKPKS